MLSLAYLTNTYSMGSCNLSSRWNADIALNQHIFKMHKMGASSSSVDHSSSIPLYGRSCNGDDGGIPIIAAEAARGHIHVIRHGLEQVV